MRNTLEVAHPLRRMLHDRNDDTNLQFLTSLASPNGPTQGHWEKWGFTVTSICELSDETYVKEKGSTLRELDER